MCGAKRGKKNTLNESENCARMNWKKLSVRDLLKIVNKWRMKRELLEFVRFNLFSAETDII
jgi:hypothetical protein